MVGRRLAVKRMPELMRHRRPGPAHHHAVLRLGECSGGRLRNGHLLYLGHAGEHLPRHLLVANVHRKPDARALHRQGGRLLR